jgi:ribonuclease HII
VTAPEFTIGIDEVGTGALAGPAFIGAVVVPRGWERPAGLKDSKKMSWGGRARMYGILVEQVTAFRIITISNTYIDKHGLRKAWLDGVEAALKELTVLYPNYGLIIDGEIGHPNYNGRAIPKADATVPAVSAASVLAKVNRDMLMIKLHADYPHYDWKNNVGYGAHKHWVGLEAHGISPHHRLSYGPIRRIAEKFRANGRHQPEGDFPK